MEIVIYFLIGSLIGELILRSFGRNGIWTDIYNWFKNSK